MRENTTAATPLTRADVRERIESVDILHGDVMLGMLFRYGVAAGATHAKPWGWQHWVAGARGDADTKELAIAALIAAENERREK